MYRLQNKNGVEISFLSLGGKLGSVLLPSEKGKTDVLLGYDTVQEFLHGDPFFGALVGRYANRIANGSLILDGKKIQLEKNHEPNHLHGGNHGFYAKEWEVNPTILPGFSSAYRLSLLSEDGEEHYPGNLQVDVLYALNDGNEFLIDFKARTDKTTVVNLTSHPYFNLNGPGDETIQNHYLQVCADHYTPLNKFFIPTGELKHVSNTGMDLRNPVKIQEIISSDDPDLLLRGGLDHNWVIRRKEYDLVKAAVLSVPERGRKVEIFTTQPGLQVYAGMHFDGKERGKGGYPIKAYGGIALEPQNFPDAPNKSNFPNAVLHPGEEYHEQILFRFFF